LYIKLDNNLESTTTLHLRVGPGAFVTAGNEGSLIIHEKEVDDKWNIGFGGDYALLKKSGGAQVLVNLDGVSGSLSGKSNAFGFSTGIDFTYTFKTKELIEDINGE
jgi:hypothetical protein